MTTFRLPIVSSQRVNLWSKICFQQQFAQSTMETRSDKLPVSKYCWIMHYFMEIQLAISRICSTHLSINYNRNLINICLWLFAIGIIIRQISCIHVHFFLIQERFTCTYVQMSQCNVASIAWETHVQVCQIYRFWTFGCRMVLYAENLPWREGTYSAFPASPPPRGLLSSSPRPAWKLVEENKMRSGCVRLCVGAGQRFFKVSLCALG